MWYVGFLTVVMLVIVAMAMFGVTMWWLFLWRRGWRE
jgi:hypothetical protein